MDTAQKYSIMNELHKQDVYGTKLKPEGGLQASLCSNNVLSCSSPLGFIDMSSDEEQGIDYLADILVEAFINMKKNENYKFKQSN